MTRPVVAIVHLGRAGGMGALRRVDGLSTVFEAAGAEVVELPVMGDHAFAARDLRRIPVGALAKGSIVPEVMAWSHTSALAALDRLEPDVVICETSRAYHPSFAPRPWHLIVDYVDRLSISYRDRAAIVTSPARRALFRALSWPSARFERHRLPTGVSAIAAGWSDAAVLRAKWVPITFELPALVPTVPQYDLVFFGNLSYPPNVEGVRRLAAFWPALQDARPGTTMLLAGARPGDDIRALATSRQWTLQPDFPDLATMLLSARIGVVPLIHASGIQTKVLEAAAFGLPQIVDPVAIAGMEPGFPALVAADDDAMVRGIVDLLGDDVARRKLGTDARAHIGARYSAAAWTPWAEKLLAAHGG